MRYAVLEGKKVVETDSNYKWAIWASNKPHSSRIENTPIKEADIWVDTVFIGMDMSFGSGKPLWFETLIDYAGDSDDMFRYHTYDESVIGHVKCVTKVLLKHYKEEIHKPYFEIDKITEKYLSGFNNLDYDGALEVFYEEFNNFSG